MHKDRGLVFGWSSASSTGVFSKRRWNSQTCLCTQDAQRNIEILSVNLFLFIPLTTISFSALFSIMNYHKHWRAAQTTEGDVQGTKTNKIPFAETTTEHSFIKTNPSSLFRKKESGRLARMHPSQQLFTAVREMNSQKSPTQQ